jgi:superfamily II DNA or RNA helicase
METELSARGYSIALNTLPSHFLENIKRELYVKPLENPNFPGNVQGFPVYRVSKTKVYMPRYYGITNYNEPKTNKFADPDPIELQFEGNLRPVQKETIDKTLDALGLYGGGVISLDTGLGKTVVALHLVSLLQVKSIIIVHAEFLLDQWVERIKQYLPTARIGIIRQERCELENVDIVVAMLQTVINRDISFKGFGLLTVDECHHTAAHSFSSIFYKIQTKYMIGLSATPDRKDGLTKVLYWFLGPQIVNIKRETDKPSIRFVKTDTRNYEEKLNRIGKINSPVMITELSNRKERSYLIVRLIKEYLTENRKILVLSDRREHCEYLCNFLKSENISAGVYLGGMKTGERTDSVNCSVILGTYQASGEGFDVPELDTLVLATPKSDVQQAVGRILRQKNKNVPLVIDIVDEFSIFKAQWYKRKRFYKSENFKILS